MATFAHKDDESPSAGTLNKLAKAGHTVFLVAVTQGELGSRERSTRRTIKRREKEFQEAAALIGAHPISLSHLEGEYNAQRIQRELTAVARDVQADVFVTHPYDDYHPIHRQVSEATKWAAFYMAATPYKAKTRRLKGYDSAGMVEEIRRNRFRRNVPALQEQEIAVYETDPQGLKRRDSTHGGYDRKNLAPVGLIVQLEPDEAKLRGIVYDTYLSQVELRGWQMRSYSDQLLHEAQVRGSQANCEYGEGFTHVSWGGETFSTRNILAEMLPGQVYAVTVD